MSGFGDKKSGLLRRECRCMLETSALGVGPLKGYLICPHHSTAQRAEGTAEVTQPRLVPTLRDFPNPQSRSSEPESRA